MEFKLVVDGVDPWTGEYPCSLDFTNRELHRIFEISGVYGADLFEALRKYHAAAYVAVAVVVLARNGKAVDPDDFWDAEGGNISVVSNQKDEESDGPLASTPDASSDDGSENESSSGPSSDPVGD